MRFACRFASLAANRDVAGWRMGGEWIVSGEHDNTGNTPGGYGVVNLSARYNITKAWYVAAQIQHLFDKDYELAYTYNTPRRSADLTFGWQQQ
jgi:vitamin B12 transporter